jgi:adenosine/AMP kinase
VRIYLQRRILKIAAGHTFLILFTGAYPINIIANVRNVSEVATIYCATNNPVKVIVANAENVAQSSVLSMVSHRVQ